MLDGAFFSVMFYVRRGVRFLLPLRGDRKRSHIKHSHSLLSVREAGHCVSVEHAGWQLLHQPQEVCEAQPLAASAAAVEAGEHVTYVALAHIEPERR